MNPLDWPAEPFLALYAALAVVLVAATSALRASLGGGAARNPSLNAAELAYLSGGAARVGDVALLRLLSSGGAAMAAKTHWITITDASPLAALAPGAPRLAGDLTRKQFQAALAPMVETIRDRLESLGLSPSDAQVSSYRLAVLPLFAALAAFGAAKAYVGGGRGHPIGFLLLLLAATAIAAVLLSRRPTRTRAGAAALRAQRAAHARAARAPQANELLLAVALTGPVVLSGTAYAAIYDASRNSGGGNDGGSGCGGGGGGGGCGGCS